MDPAELSRMEAICNVFYTQPGSPDWTAAKAHVDALSTSAEHITTCQQLLDHSQSPYALLLASTVLKSLVTSHWNNFSVTQHVTIRDYLLKYLAEKGPTLPVFVLTALLSLLARLTKLGWFDDPKHRDIVSEVTKFLTASIDHCGVGLRALNCLVEEFNVPVSGRTLTHHRKTAVSFRDAGLFECFELGIGMLQQLASDQLSGCTPPQRSLLGDQALLLLIKCLSYDFIGTNPDESGDDVGTIQLPSSWREAVAAPTTMELLLQLYSSAEPPLSAHAMECVVLLSSVRRSLFRTEGERGQHLNRIMTAIGDVLRGGTGLGHSENYHEFCRLLGRLKANYQLSELMNSSGFSEWLELVTTFTEQSCRQWQVAANSLQYLLALWVRLVAAVPYVSTDDSHSSSSGGGGSGSYASYRSSYPPGGTPHVIGSAISDRGASSSASSGGAGAGGGGAAPESATTLAVRQLEACIERVVAAYVEGLLSAVRTCAADDTLDDPLEDTEQVDEQLQRLPSIFRYRYEPSAAFLVSRMDPLLASYQQVVQGNEAAAVAVATAAATSGVAGGAGGSPSEAVELLENELAWLVGVCGAVVGGLSWSSSLVVGHEALDGQLAKRCFACAQMVNFKAEQSQGSQCCTERLELALLNFLSHFRRVYLADAAAASLPTAAASAGGASSSSTSGAMAAAYSASQTLQALGTPLSALAWDAEHEDGTTGPMTVKQRAVRSMLAAMEQADAGACLSAIMNHIFTGLRFRADSEQVLEATITLFLEMSGGITASAHLATLPACHSLLTHHTPHHFPFLARPANRRLRTKFHAALARLVFQQPPDSVEVAFTTFMTPVSSVLNDLASVPTAQLSADARCRDALQGVLRDVRGIAEAATLRKTYLLLFETLHPDPLLLFARAAEAYAPTRDGDMCSLLFKCLTEIGSNRSQRAVFGNSSANGYLLFRAVSSAVGAFGNAVVGAPSSLSSSSPSLSAAGSSSASSVGVESATSLSSATPNEGGSDLYRNTFKPRAACLACVREVLTGGYVNFGVLQLYGDPCLSVMLDTCLGLLLSISTEHVLAYPKLAKPYFAVLEALFASHLPFLAAKDRATFSKLLEVLYSGLQGLEAPMSTHCSYAMDHLASYLFLHRDAKPGSVESDAMLLLRDHCAANPRLFPDLIAKLFEQLLFGPYSSHWMVTRPLLPLMLADEGSFNAYRAHLISTQAPENQGLLHEAFEKLTADIEKSLEVTIRDRFAQRLANFRQRVREFLTI